MYVIATVFCSNFHFSVSLHVPFSQFLFERDSYSNEYLLAKICFDTAENEPSKVCVRAIRKVAAVLKLPGLQRCGYSASQDPRVPLLQLDQNLRLSALREEDLASGDLVKDTSE